MFTDAEVYFDGKTVLDNAIEVRAVVELETEARNDRNADEVYIDIVTGFGKLRVGEKEGVNAGMIGEPTPEALLTTDEEVIGDALRRRTGITVKDAFTFKRFSNDVLTVSYETPAIIPGVKFGVSYSPQTSDLEGSFDRRAVEHDAFDVSGRYEGRFKGGSYRLGVGHFTSRSRVGGNDGNQAFTVHAGATYGGWDLGGSYAASDPATGVDEKSWAAGLLYGIGPYKVSLNHFAARCDTRPAKEDVDRTSLQFAYRIGPGINVGLTGFYAQQRDARGVAFDGLGALVGIKLAFSN
jgi:predicted porin